VSPRGFEADWRVLQINRDTLGVPVHPMQYAMTGAALSVFYFSGVLRSRRAGFVTGVLAGVCYSLMYLLVLSEDYALLFGAQES
jgi:inner membrane protein involved in colicin E2 resistance